MGTLNSISDLLKFSQNYEGSCHVVDIAKDTKQVPIIRCNVKRGNFGQFLTLTLP